MESLQQKSANRSLHAFDLAASVHAGILCYPSRRSSQLLSLLCLACSWVHTEAFSKTLIA
eukprot:scaffold101955_cov22-Tisochrysis_lutea.AAC.2